MKTRDVFTVIKGPACNSPVTLFSFPPFIVEIQTDDLHRQQISGEVLADPLRFEEPLSVDGCHASASRCSDRLPVI